MQITTLFCTAGTSLLTNFNQNPRNSPELNSRNAGWKALYNNNEMQQLVHQMARLSANDRQLGAEISSINSMYNQKLLAEQINLIIQVSDTDDGRRIGQLLKGLSEKLFKIPAKNIEIMATPGLATDNPAQFAGQGLRSLIRNIADAVRRYGTESFGINATGGFKAQILFAGVMGQTLGVPVYYMHELFQTIIELPPLPVAMDMELWLEHVSDFYRVSEQQLVLRSELNRLPDEMRAANLIERETLDGEEYIGLTPVGQIFHEGFAWRASHLIEQQLPAPCAAAPDEKKFTQEPGAPNNRPPGIENLVSKLFQIPWITKAHSFYYNKDLPETALFRISAKCSVDMIELVYSDGKATAKLILSTTAKTVGNSRRHLLHCRKYCKIKLIYVMLI